MKRDRVVGLPGWAVTLIIATMILVLVAAVAGIAALVNLMAQAGEFPPQTPVVVPVTPPTDPYIRLSPSRGAPGTLVTVTGYDWQPGDAVVLFLDDPTNPTGARARLGTTTVRGDGGFVAGISAPTYAPWSELDALLVTAESLARGSRASSGFLLVSSASPPTSAPLTATPAEGAVEPAASPTTTLMPTDTPAPPSPTPVTPSATPYVPSATPLPPTATPAPFVPTATPRPTVTPTLTPVITDWRGEYYANAQLVGSPVSVRNDIGINYNWGSESPAPGAPADGFSVRWTRSLYFDEGNYRFYALVDDGVRIFVDNTLVVDEWVGGSQREVSGDGRLLSGWHGVRVEYFENAGTALIRVWWERVTDYPEWRGEYYANPVLSGSPALVRNDVDLSMNWGNGAPADNLPADNFTVRWTRALRFSEGTYTFRVNVDDGVRLYVDNNLVLERWSDGPHQVAGDYAMTDGYHALRVEYLEHVGDAGIDVGWEKVTSFPDWRAEYFGNRNLDGSPSVVRNDREIHFDWGEGAPTSSVPADNFGVRWSRRASFEQGAYRFHAVVDDGVRLWADGYLLIDEWETGPSREKTADFSLTAGQHDLRVDYFEAGGGAVIHVWWERLPSPNFVDWKGEYWTNRDLAGSPALVRNDRAIDFDWRDGAPQVGLPKDDFSVRWSRWADFEAGIYRFQAQADDGIRFYMDGNRYLDEWHTARADSVYTIDLPLIGPHWLVVEHYEGGGSARAKFWWQRLGPIPSATPTARPTATPVPTAEPGAGTVVVNEVLLRPSAVDWNGDGWKNADDQWIELYNRGIESVDISGWFVDDGPEGSLPHHLSAGTILGRGQFLVLYRRNTSITLRETGDTVRLLDRGGRVLDQVAVPALGEDASYSRARENAWYPDWPPSPGQINLPRRLIPRAGRGVVE